MKQLIIASALTLSAATAQAIECQPAAPAQPINHWSYRMIDGRRCWYEGNNMISKSLLHWQTFKNDAAEGAGSVLTQAPEEEMGIAPTFEYRWRGIFGRAGLQP
jgi:hypothetical protein